MPLAGRHSGAVQPLPDGEHELGMEGASLNPAIPFIAFGLTGITLGLAAYNLLGSEIALSSVRRLGRDHYRHAPPAVLPGGSPK